LVYIDPANATGEHDAMSILRFVAAVSLVTIAGCVEPPEETALPLTVTSQDFGDYVLHFNALTTDQLIAAVAQQHGIVRSGNRAMLSITILRKNDGGVPTPVAGDVSVSANNLTGQLKNIVVREVREQEAIYYIAECAVADGENLIFSIDATPVNETEPLSVRYRKQFFTN